MEIYLRPLQVTDALTSFKWRNNPAIWKHTGSQPNILITKELETEWLEETLLRENEKRYAICIVKTKEYIGNIQLTNIANGLAEFHIFIGETKYWGIGIGNKATKLMLDIGIKELKLKEIYLSVSKKNVAALRLYLKIGFMVTQEEDVNYKMSFKNPSL